MAERWHDLGPIDELVSHPLTQVTAGRTRIALSAVDGVFGAISGRCNHVGGPLGEGTLDGDYVVCPWHHWKFHRRTGLGEPGFEGDAVPRYELEARDGHLFVDLTPATRRRKLPHPPHPLARRSGREPGPVRVAGISTTAMDRAWPRYSTSEALLETAIAHAAAGGAETRLLRLADLSFRHCEGYYSKSAHACTWPCSITQMDPGDQLDRVYEAVVHWGDVLLVATPIRWGAASSLYFKMVERMNCIQNQITLANRVLLRDKVTAFIITGGQDNVQGVAGQMMSFFGELGCVFPQFPFIAHTRGWTAEDMERNVAFVRESRELHDGARALVERSVEMARRLLGSEVCRERIVRAGRKASGGVHAAPSGEAPGDDGDDPADPAR
jgi:nitrite reductase/ring-hydroxylating ferredoxin subunit/multimeric flavodoxin WrbA